jgi:hypothetical protein
MKTIEKLKAKEAETTFSAVALVVLLLILPNLGGTAMLVGSIVALCVYTFIFKECMRDHRGSVTKAVFLTVFFVVVAIAVVVSFIGRHWL